MELKYKPDFEEARRHWAAYWEGEIIDRPVVCVTANKEGAEKISWPAYLGVFDEDRAKVFETIDCYLSYRHHAGDSMPAYEPCMGPDQFAAFLGSDLAYPNVHSTSWAAPCIDDWDNFEIKLDPENAYWKKMQTYMKELAEFADGKFLVSTLDTHSNIDALSAMRGTERLCMDLIDCPEVIDRAMKQVRSLYAPVYDRLYELGGMKKRGTTGWLRAYCEKRFAVIQCDFIYMVGREHSKRFIIPALEEEASFLDHCIYHYDGVGALRHMDDILGIKEIDVIQWEPGAGQQPTWGWIELLQKIQKAGKGLWLYGWPPEAVKTYYKELKPEGLIFYLWADSPKNAEDMVKWFKDNT